MSFFGMVFCSFFCAFQSDSKSLVAYSSIVHMSFILFVICSFCSLSKYSSNLMMISHGFVSFLVFYFVGEVYYILGTRLVFFFLAFFLLTIFLFFFYLWFYCVTEGFPCLCLFFLSFWVSFLFFFFSFFLLLFYFFIFFFLFIIVFFFFWVFFLVGGILFFLILLFFTGFLFFFSVLIFFFLFGFVF